MVWKVINEYCLWCCFTPYFVFSGADTAKYLQILKIKDFSRICSIYPDRYQDQHLADATINLAIVYCPLHTILLRKSSCSFSHNALFWHLGGLLSVLAKDGINSERNNVLEAMLRLVSFVNKFPFIYGCWRLFHL